MDNQRAAINELIKTTHQMKKRLELERFFAEDFFITKTNTKNISSDKNKQIAELYAHVENCKQCSLYSSRTNLVFGSGNLDAELIFVGEAPGRDEDLQGKPFVGAAGALLTKIIEAMKLKREDVYITNVLRCRPPGNRNPLPDEVISCKPYLVELLEIIKPRVICTLGKFAAHALLNETAPISRLRGRFFDFHGITLLPTYHPAYLLRNPEDKKLVWEDMKKIMKFLKTNET